MQQEAAQQGRFFGRDDVKREAINGYQLGWHTRPENTGAAHLVVIEVELGQDTGHDFHRHPRQEEVILVTAGKVIQWVGTERRELAAGESAFIPAGVVHASFNVATEPAKLVAILGPSIGSEGYELEEMHERAPWRDLDR